MRSRSFMAQNPQGQHQLHFTEWGPEDGPAVIFLHGLTLTCRSFDMVAAALSQTHRVICLDVVGRGKSDWLPDPMGYDMPQYVSDVLALISHLDINEVDLVGTSMGGIIGMLLAVQQPCPLRRLVLNDVGPFVAKESVALIREYVGTDPDFADVKEFEAYLRWIWSPFGALTDDQWRHLAETSSRVTDSGRVTSAYDPDIRKPIVAAPAEDADLWRVWDMIAVPTLALRGAESEILPSAVAQQMSRRGPQAQVIEFANIGHAPALMADDQISAITGFLTE